MARFKATIRKLVTTAGATIKDVVATLMEGRLKANPFVPSIDTLFNLITTHI